MSATLPHDVLEMTHKFMTDPVRILVKRDELTLEVSVASQAQGAGLLVCSWLSPGCGYVGMGIRGEFGIVPQV